MLERKTEREMKERRMEFELEKGMKEKIEWKIEVRKKK